MEKDLIIVGGLFYDYDVPKEKRYLFKYFKLPQDRLFVRYYLLFEGNIKHFVEHTGYYFTDRWMRIMQRHLRILETAHEKAKKEGDFEEIALIESGKWKGLPTQYSKFKDSKSKSHE